MFLNKLRSLPRTLVFRLTLLYAGIFTASSLIAFYAFYLHIGSIVRERTDRELLESIAELSAFLTARGMDGLKRTLVTEAKDDGEDNVLYRVLAHDGRELASSNASRWRGLTSNRAALETVAAGGTHVFETVSLPGRSHKVRTLYGRIGPDAILQVAWSLEEDEQFVDAFRNIFGTTVGAVMLFAALLGWFMAKRALTGVEQVTRTAQEISVGDLERRVSVKTRATEIETLATTFNGMIDRIQTLVTEMREMTDNIAHDLRSPITRIRGTAEMTLTGGKSIAEHESAAANTIEQCDRLLEMINTMLYISEAEAGAGKLKMEEIDMTRVVCDACELFQPMADDKGVRLAAEIQSDLKVRGDRQRLQRMVANMIDNAINYTPPPGAVTVSVNGDEKLGTISVKDTGIGIAQKDLPHVFRRFYRCDHSRSQPGVGLGLSLVQAIAHSHGGHITVASAPDRGSTFTVRLPRAALPF